MPAVGDLREELNDITTLKFVSSAFTEAASVKLGKIRASFEQNKAFYDEISRLYHLVTINAKRAKITVAKQLGTEGKTLSVAVTSNQRFYGNVNIQIMQTFLQESEKIKTDTFVLGQTGIDFMRSHPTNSSRQSFKFEKDTPDMKEIQAFLDRISPYEKILVYFPKFVTLLTQTVAVIDITEFASPDEKDLNEELHLIFEPELSKMLIFFETQIRMLLFLRVMLETDLSRTAARLVSMSAAEERSDEMIKEKKTQLRKVIASLINAKLLETFAGMSKWKQ